MVTERVEVLYYRQRLSFFKLHVPLIAWPTRGHETVWKNYNYLYFPLVAAKACRLLTSGRRSSKQTLKSSPSSCLNSTNIQEIEKIDLINLLITRSTTRGFPTKNKSDNCVYLLGNMLTNKQNWELVDFVIIFLIFLYTTILIFLCKTGHFETSKSFSAFGFSMIAPFKWYSFHAFTSDRCMKFKPTFVVCKSSNKWVDP